MPITPPTSERKRRGWGWFVKGTDQGFTILKPEAIEWGPYRRRKRADDAVASMAYGLGAWDVEMYQRPLKNKEIFNRYE